MIIDCNRCVMQHTTACDDCIVSVLLATGDDAIELGTDEASALGHLAEAGLVAPIRLVPLENPPDAAVS